jgi:hypothetical protein
MNTINCRIRLNEYHDGPGKKVTPAEALLLRALHNPSAARFAVSASPEESANYWKIIINPVPAGAATTRVPDAKEPENEAKTTERPRTNAEELQRLRAKYSVRAKSGAPGSHIVEDLFGPGLNPALPETFEEIGLKVELLQQPKTTQQRGQLAQKSEQTIERLEDQVAKLKKQLDKALKAAEPEADKAKGADGKK